MAVDPRIQEAFERLARGEPRQEIEGERFYVTAIDEANGRVVRSYFVAGPYESHAEAIAQVEAARRLGSAQNPWSDFFAWGTMGVGGKPVKTPLGAEWKADPR